MKYSKKCLTIQNFFHIKPWWNLFFFKNWYNDIKHNPSIFTKETFRITAGRCLESLTLVCAYSSLIHLQNYAKIGRWWHMLRSCRLRNSSKLKLSSNATLQGYETPGFVSLGCAGRELLVTAAVPIGQSVLTGCWWLLGVVPLLEMTGLLVFADVSLMEVVALLISIIMTWLLLLLSCSLPRSAAACLIVSFLNPFIGEWYFAC